MTREQIRNAVIDRTRRTDKADLINDAINLALTEIQQIRDFRSTKVEEELTLAAGTSTVTITGNVFQVRSVILFDPDDESISQSIFVKDKSWVTRRFPTLESTIEGWPSICFVEGNVITFVPPSNDEWTVRVEYFQLVPELSTDAGVVARILAGAIVCWVTSEVFRSTQQYQDANMWLGEYGRRMKLAVRADSRDHEEVMLPSFVQTEGQERVGLPVYLDPFAGSEV